MLLSLTTCRYDQKRGVAIARDGEQVHLLGAVREVLCELHTDPKWVNSKVWLRTVSINNTMFAVHRRVQYEVIYFWAFVMLVQVAIASSCDEPEWARELLKLFPIEIGEGKSVPMGSIFHAKEIKYGNKQSHFQVNTCS